MHSHLPFLRSLQPCRLRRVLLLTLLLTAAALPAAAVTHHVDVLLDLDNDASTGCTVATVEGPFDGVEQILRSVVETEMVPSPAATVVEVVRLECVGGAIFGPPILVDDGDWPVGVGLGDSASDVIETYFPGSALPPDVHAVRLGVTIVALGSGEEAALLATQQGQPILILLASILEIPTLSEWGLLLLVGLLAVAAARRLRRPAVAATLLVLLVLGGAGVAWAATVLDGDPSDWQAGDRVAGTPPAACTGLRIAALYAKLDSGQLCLRIDACLEFNTGPTITSSATPSAPENQTLAIDVETTDDVDSEGAGLTYAITGGADQALFAIDPNTGVLTFLAAPDFEAPGDADVDNVYLVQVTVTDSGGLSDVQDLQVTVTNVNEAPSITSPATASVEENQTLALDVQATDPDGETEGGGGLTYSITGGADGALFAIDAESGVLTFQTAPDFENPTDADTNNIYLVQVTVTDAGGLTDVQAIEVTVTDVNDAPTISTSATPSVEENETFVIDVDATDQDGDTEGGGGLTYAITGGADGALFAIDANSGELTFQVAPDFENPSDADANNIYLVQVTVTDSGGATGVQDLEVTVTDVNEAPSITSSATPSVEENQTLAIDVDSTDPDGETEGGGGLTYSITGGADAALFAIDADSGVLTFVSAPDFENPTDADANNVYLVQVTVTDAGGLTDAQDLTVTVTDVNEAPSITSSATPSVEENQTLAIDVDSTDPDGETEGGGGLTYSITGGADAALFAIDANSGELTFLSAPDFENPTDADANNVYLVQVTVTDAGGLTDVQDLAVTVTDVNEGPSITSSATPSVAENQTLAIDVDSTDPDGETEGGGGLTYSITGGADAALFTIDANSGVLTFLSAPDFENPTDADANNVYLVQVTVTDGGGLTDVQDLAVTVTDVNEAPSITTSATPSAPENQTLAIDVDSTDPDGETEGGGGLTYSITGGTDAALFTIDVNSGMLTFLSAPDFENPTDADANNVYLVQVTVTDAGGLTDVQDLAVTVTDVNEAPSITSSATASVEENQTLAIDVDSTDPDGETEGGGGLTYSITGGADAALFAIDANSGVLTFVSAPDFENPTDADANNVYLVQVTVTDGGGLTDVQDLAVTVTDVNEAPSITSSATPSVPENTTLVVDVDSIDPEGETEGGGGLTYAITGGADAALFALDANSGVLTFVSAPDFENPADANADNVYLVQVTVTDGDGLTGVQDLAVTVTDVNEPPTANPDTADIDEEAPNVAALNQVSGNVLTNDTDPDADLLTVSAVAGGSVGSPLAGTYGSVTINADGSFTYTLDDDNPAVDVLNVGDTLSDVFGYTASDGEFTDSSTLTVTIHGADDPPTAVADTFDFIGNTLLEVDCAAGDCAVSSAPKVLATTTVNPAAHGVLDNDFDPDGGPPITISGIVGCADLTAPFVCAVSGGTVSLHADGSFSFEPEAGNTDPTATFEYTLTGNPIAGSVTINRFERVWWVDPAAGGGGDGTSHDPFNTLDDLDGAGGAGDDDVAGDYIFVHAGTLALSAPMEMEASQHLIGEGVGLSIPVALNGNASPTVLVAAGTRPQLTNTTGDAVRVVHAIPVQIVGLSLASGAGNAIDLTSAAALAGSGTLTIANNQFRGASAEGIDVNLNGGTTGTLGLTIANNTWDLAGTHTGNAIDVDATRATLHLEPQQQHQRAVERRRRSTSTATHSAHTTITGFASNTVHQNTGGSGINVTSVRFDGTPAGAYNQCQRRPHRRRNAGRRRRRRRGYAHQRHGRPRLYRSRRLRQLRHRRRCHHGHRCGQRGDRHRHAGHRRGRSRHRGGDRRPGGQPQQPHRRPPAVEPREHQHDDQGRVVDQRDRRRRTRPSTPSSRPPSGSTITTTAGAPAPRSRSAAATPRSPTPARSPTTARAARFRSTAGAATTRTTTCCSRAPSTRTARASWSTATAAPARSPSAAGWTSTPRPGRASPRRATPTAAGCTSPAPTRSTR
jgi:VCBS repeat-containing protein